MSDTMMVVTVAVVAVLVLIIVFMAVDGGSNSVTNVFWRRGHHYPYGPGHSSRWGPYYQHGGRTPTNGLLY